MPLVVVLDEAANVCRWSELPNLHSHYGSRGICGLTILQSWSQGVEAFLEAIKASIRRHDPAGEQTILDLDLDLDLDRERALNLREAATP
ncbi:TraM recognition domain-containing protein [Cellulomonas sp.]|uniref:TraM recognition domain-containing protein n=1 Tax=Cellulomonas sp. TaxID=40001 RepID=UPI0025BA3514|nr:TraM recognition domain-containing protein [Cellulomonas sp.]